jgi:hypothetical protein
VADHGAAIDVRQSGDREFGDGDVLLHRESVAVLEASDGGGSVKRDLDHAELRELVDLYAAGVDATELSDALRCDYVRCER